MKFSIIACCVALVAGQKKYAHIPTPSYACPTGYTLSGQSCSRTIIVDKIAVTEQTQIPHISCPSGTSGPGKDGMCTDTITTTTMVESTETNFIPQVTTYSTEYTSSWACPAGSIDSGKGCVTTSTVSATPVTTSLRGGKKGQVYTSISYTCPSGYTLSGKNTCSGSTTVSKVESKTAIQVPSTSCPNGVPSGNGMCAITTTVSTPVTNTQYVSVAPVTTYTTSTSVSYECPTGTYESGKGCASTETVPATASYKTVPAAASYKKW